VANFDKAKPAGSQKLRLADDDLRTNNDALEDAIGRDHKFPTGYGVDAGMHAVIQVISQVGDEAAHATAIKLWNKAGDFRGIVPGGTAFSFAAKGTLDAPTGTEMVFIQNAAPTGWTRNAARQDNAVLCYASAGNPASGGGVNPQSTHTHTGPSHTHTGPSHTHTVASHTHTGPSHTHTGPNHTHTGPSHAHTIAHTHTGPNHTHTGPSHTHTGPSHAHNFAYGAGVGYAGVYNVGMTGSPTGQLVAYGNPGGTTYYPTLGYTLADGTGATGADGTGATGAEGTGATSGSSAANSGADGTGATSAAGTGATSAAGTGATSGTGLTSNAEGTGATGADGTGATGANTAPFFIETISCIKD